MDISLTPSLCGLSDLSFALPPLSETSTPRLLLLAISTATALFLTSFFLVTSLSRHRSLLENVKLTHQVFRVIYHQYYKMSGASAVKGAIIMGTPPALVAE